MAVSVEEISAQIRAALPDANVRVTDTTGGGDHFAAIVVSASFRGQSLVDRHRTVYGALDAALHNGAIHALALTTLTPDEQERTSP
jgi:stress-induced morphogen